MILSNILTVEFAISVLTSLQLRVEGGNWYTWGSRGDSLVFLGDYPLLVIVLFIIVIGGLCVMGYRLFRIFYNPK